jgi:DNA-binding response OmpR family regulator
MFRILVVDDDQHILDMLVRMLEIEGFDVTAAADGRQALQLIGPNEYDLVITDWKMPALSGLNLLQQIRLAHPRLEVMMMTAFGSVDSAVEAMKLGACDYLTKPFHREE